MRNNTCKSCGAAIRWLQTPKGKWMPVDAEPASDGKFVIRANRVVMIQPDMFNGVPSGPRYLCHFATCPHAKQHRKEE